MADPTIVIVEDEAAIADALAARLRAEGFAVEIGAGDYVTKPLGRPERRQLGADVLRAVQGIGYAFGEPAR